MHRLATDVPFIACVINLPCTFTYYLDLSNFILEYGLSCFRVLTICLLLVYFVSAAVCHCFDSQSCTESRAPDLSSQLHFVSRSESGLAKDSLMWGF